MGVSFEEQHQAPNYADGLRPSRPKMVGIKALSILHFDHGISFDASISSYDLFVLSSSNQSLGIHISIECNKIICNIFAVRR